MQSDHSAPTPARQFPGYPVLHYTPIPDLLFDEQLPDLSGSELKVLLYIFRHTFGWKKHYDDISLSQIVKGVVKKDGSRLDRGAGVSQTSALRALAALEDRGFIVARRNHGPNGENLTTTYIVPVIGEEPEPYPQNGGSPLPKVERPLPPKVETQETRTTRDMTGKREASRFEGSTSLGIAYDLEGIEQMVADFRREFRDKAALGPTRQRTINLFQNAGVSVEEFVEAMYEARRITKGAAVHKESPMAYWFAVLEDRLR